jgi:hypothetical protein
MAYMFHQNVSGSLVLIEGIGFVPSARRHKQGSRKQFLSRSARLLEQTEKMLD